MRSLTSGQLQVAANVPRDVARIWFEPLNVGAAEASVNTPRRWAMWIAQLAHESGGFTRLTESFDYDPIGLLRTWPSRYTPELAEQHGRGPGKRAVHHKIATHVYNGRMGNRNGTDDGFAFRGRGLIQLTGRENYVSAGLALGIDLAGDPDKARQPEVAARIALSVGFYRPVSDAHRVRCPVLVQVCERDSVAPAAAAERAIAGLGALAEVRRYPIGHFEPYFGEHFEHSVTDQLEFLRARLAP
jgi:putative chitinase